MADFIQLDGSFGEGGGAILRQALALSMATGRAFKINNIRKGRCNPGLAPQHLAGVNAAKDLCDAEVKGHAIGSTEISFKPGEVKAGRYKIDIGTAGSITLLLQSLLLPSIFSGKKISFHIKGGTDVKWSQPYDYFKFVFLPQMKRYAEVEANLFKRGYYPKGGGEIKVSINGKYILGGAGENKEPPSILLLEQKKLLQIKGISHASIDLENAKVAERQAESARLALDELGIPFNVKHEYSKSFSTGSGLTLWAVFGEEEVDFENPNILGADSLGERGKRAELVGEEAGNNLIDVVDSGAAVDMYLADQLIPFLGIAGGVIKTSQITNHVKSNIYVAEKFLKVKFSIKDNIISCEK
ncbi:RNA 3'-terminal phosphate cyclase [Candidatus Woesearchaeota archaeon]|nr:RNA 3'-terminal phosphate cyclase [Candidatus Woesearchaeota archaeon]